MSKIIVLDELTAAQIAAGEVIERPASVVKETVENALDAGATAITVEIKGGGIRFIRITDNGCGFEADDAVLAFDKHATSKITSGADLEQIQTLGFRGEALASIAAVADVELLSRTEDANMGVYVHIKGGDVLDQGAKGCAKGTVLTVRELFYNTPARYKFLKRDQTEAGYISDIVQKLAMANPGVSFRVISNGQEILRTPGGGDLRAAVYSIFGRETAANLLTVEHTEGDVRISGFVGVRDAVYGNRNRQIFYVNHRNIKSKLITAALDEAYQTVTMKHKFPFALLHIQYNRVGFNGVAVFVGDNTVDSSACSGRGHFHCVGVACEGCGYFVGAGSCVFVIPLVGKSITFCCKGYCGGFAVLYRYACWLLCDLYRLCHTQCYSFGGYGVAVLIGDYTVYLSAGSCFVHCDLVACSGERCGQGKVFCSCIFVIPLVGKSVSFCLNRYFCRCSAYYLYILWLC